jgi:hypothetical protein
MGLLRLWAVHDSDFVQQEVLNKSTSERFLKARRDAPYPVIPRVLGNGLVLSVLSGWRRRLFFKGFVLGQTFR